MKTVTPVLRMIVACFWLALMLSSVAWAAEDLRTPPASILQLGIAQSVDLDPATIPKRGWLALIQDHHDWELVPAKVSARCLNADDFCTVISNQPRALALLHHHGLSAGSVPAADMKFGKYGLGVYREQGPNSLDIPFRSEHYLLRVTSEGAILLSQGRTTTVLDDSDRRDGATLNWAGDLDHDGKLDLIVSPASEENVEFCLYLSSAARGNELVKQIDCQAFSG